MFIYTHYLSLGYFPTNSRIIFKRVLAEDVCSGLMEKFKRVVTSLVGRGVATNCVMFVSSHPPSDIGNSFCLVAKMLDSGSKGPRFQSSYCHSGDPEEHATPTFSPTTRWQHQKSHLLLRPTDGSTSTPSCPTYKVCDAQSL
ncbi:hypothetical protein AVEN_77511-1 [Araneus ventricosus]|uniref:Uncharacterized protein n=1 Tax=Araneus ventricosus TaxID=182803 RepID=A0A4Y2F398_ARAVE|nr:hypothetical protein AVEN_77511-1 [Araneus ventricosus]